MIAYTEKLGFDVLTTPIAEVDRRTLSQAWFSALHLGTARQAQVTALPCKDNATGGRTAQKRTLQAGNTQEFYARSSRPRARSQMTRDVRQDGEMHIERREPTSVLARRIERAMLDRSVRHGTFVLDGMNGRVHLSVRSSKGRIHIVALCSPRAKSYVAQALQHVRFSLAQKGIVFSGSLQGTNEHPWFTERGAL